VGVLAVKAQKEGPCNVAIVRKNTHGVTILARSLTFT